VVQQKLALEAAERSGHGHEQKFMLHIFSKWYVFELIGILKKVSLI
jgi:hypothetical protein